MDEIEAVDMGGFFLYDDKLVVEFGDDPDNPKSVTLEFNNDNERALVGNVLDDRNFWVQIVNALSSSLKQTAG